MQQIDYYSDHVTKSHHSLQQIADRAIEKIQNSDIKFDSFACTGISGLVLAPILSIMMEKELTIVRKEWDKTHSGNTVEGVIDCDYIIVDDFIASGTSINKIWRAIQKVSPSSKCVGIYLHRDNRFHLPHIEQGMNGSYLSI